jgi:hypothetical protein
VEPSSRKTAATTSRPTPRTKSISKTSTAALDVLKIGEPAKVVYIRGGQRRETTLTPPRGNETRRSPFGGAMGPISGSPVFAGTGPRAIITIGVVQ